MAPATCDELHPFFDGELPADRADAFRAHLGSCEACQRELEDVIQLQDLASDVAQEERTGPGRVVDFKAAAEKRKPRRTFIAVASGVLAAAAAIAFAVVPRGDADPFGLGKTRSLEARLTHQGAREHRDYDVQRSAGPAATAIPLSGLARMEERGDLHGVATGHLLRGERDQAAQLLAKAKPSPEVQSDLAVVALSKGAPDEALILLDGVLEERPGHPQAMWNRGLALRELGLPLAAAEAFGEVVKLREPGWAEEAARRAAALSADAHRLEASWAAASGAASAMLTRNEPVPPDLLRRHPGSVRGYFYEALRTAPTAERVRMLRPTAAALDEVFGGQVLVKLVDRAAASDFDKRGPLAARYARLGAGQLDGAATSALLEETAHAGYPEIRLGTLWQTRSVGLHLAEYQAIAAELGDPWFISLGQQQQAKTFQASRPLEAEARLRAALQYATAQHLEQHVVTIEHELSIVALSLHRVADAWSHGQAAFRLARRIEDHQRRISAVHQLAVVARMRLAFSLARAYLREALLAGTAECTVGQFVHESLAELALLELRGELARRELGLAPECGQPPQLHALSVTADVARLDPRPGDLERVKKLAAALRAGGTLGPASLLYADAFEAAVLIESDAAAASQTLRRVIAEAEKLSGDVDAQKARGYAYATLISEAGRTGRFDEALKLLAAEAHAPATTRCAVGLSVDDARSVIAVLPAHGEATGEYDANRREPMVRWRPQIGGALLAALQGCEVVDVLARSPIQGRTDVLPPGIAWRYQVQGGAQPGRGKPARRLLVSGVEAPASLGLPRLEPLGAQGTDPAEVELRGASATPSRVLAAMRDATEIELHAHGLADLAASDASLLVLSPDEDGTYALTARDVRAARLEGAPLVTLAACKGAQPGTALFAPWSLPIAFLQAGARAVFAAQGDVQDSQARPFFDAVRARMRAGASPAVALRDERLAWAGKPGAEWARSILLFE